MEFVPFKDFRSPGKGLSIQARIFVNRMERDARIEFEELAACLEYEQGLAAGDAEVRAFEWIWYERKNELLRRKSEQADGARGRICCDRPNGECECATPFGRVE